MSTNFKFFENLFNKLYWVWTIFFYKSFAYTSFFSNKIKQNFYNSISFNTNICTNTYLLSLKRKFSFLKNKYNEKSFLLYKINFILDLKKQKNNLKKKHFIFFKKKQFTKYFFKKSRNIFQSKTINANQKKTTKKNKFVFNSYNFPIFFQKKTLIFYLLNLNYFYNYADAFFFIKNFGVLVNNKLVNNPNTLLFSNDFIKFNADFYFYFYVFYKNKSLKKYFKKVKPRIFKLIKSKQNSNKQSITTFPKWALKFKYYKSNLINNIEYDFYTFSFVILFSFNDYKTIFFDSNSFKYSIYLNRLYNWKYIV